MADEIMLSLDLGSQGPIDITFTDFAEGPHKGRIEDVTKSAEGKGSYRFMVSDLEDDSPTKGVTGRITIGSDFTTNHAKKPGAKHFNMNAAMVANMLASIGIPLHLIKGKIDLPLSKLVGKECFFYVENPAEEFDDSGRKNYQDRKFIKPEEYAALKKGKAAVRTSAKSNGATPMKAEPKVEAKTETPPPADPGLNDLFNNP